MNIAIIGTGNIARGLARVLGPTRHGVVVAGRELQDGADLAAILSKDGIAVQAAFEADAVVSIDHITAGYYSIRALNPFGIVPIAPARLPGITKIRCLRWRYDPPAPPYRPAAWSWRARPGPYRLDPIQSSPASSGDIAPISNLPRDRPYIVPLPVRGLR